MNYLKVSDLKNLLAIIHSSIECKNQSKARKEKFLLIMLNIIQFVKAGEKVALLQRSKKSALSFDPRGDIVISINEYPMFRINSDDMDIEYLNKLGLVNMVAKEKDCVVDYHIWFNSVKI